MSLQLMKTVCFLPCMWKVGKFVEKSLLLRAFNNCGPIYGKLCVVLVLVKVV